jgi:GR25 family glycosyltransferase involved in LPS biosynthesis
VKAYCIILDGHAYSERVGQRCIDTAKQFGVAVERFRAVDKTLALEVMQQYGLRWTWGSNNVLTHHEYGGPLETRVGCAMSHYLLWRKCVELDVPILVLEHDAVFIRELPEIDFAGICQINDPDGATRRGKWWSDQIRGRPAGVYPKTWVTDDKRVPDGLAGNSAYLIKPRAAKELIEKCHEIGLWPNDAIMCAQFFPYLQELCPPVTRVMQEQSTTSR